MTDLTKTLTNAEKVARLQDLLTEAMDLCVDLRKADLSKNGREWLDRVESNVETAGDEARYIRFNSPVVDVTVEPPQAPVEYNEGDQVELLHQATGYYESEEAKGPEFVAIPKGSIGTVVEIHKTPHHMLDLLTICFDDPKACLRIQREILMDGAMFKKV